MGVGAGQGIHREAREFLDGLITELLAFAEQTFRRAMPVEGAPTLGTDAAHRASVERQTGRPMAVEGDGDADLELPAPLSYLWEWFLLDLIGRRSSNGMGPNPLSHLEVESWSRLHRIDIEPWEVRVLMHIDDCRTVSLQSPPSAS